MVSKLVKKYTESVQKEEQRAGKIKRQFASSKPRIFLL